MVKSQSGEIKDSVGLCLFATRRVFGAPCIVFSLASLTEILMIMLAHALLRLQGYLHGHGFKMMQAL
jgi:hypothetical protein